MPSSPSQRVPSSPAGRSQAQESGQDGASEAQSPKARPTVECPVCGRHVLASSLAEHTKRCEEICNLHAEGARRAAAELSAEGGNAAAAAKAANSRPSWGEVPSPSNASRPATKHCEACDCHVLVSSFEVHQKRCSLNRQQGTGPQSVKGQSPKSSHPHRRSLWSDVDSPVQASGSPTTQCDVCGMGILSSRFEQHHERCLQKPRPRSTVPRQARSASPPPSPNRRSLWSDVASPATSGPVTVQCTLCLKQTLASSYEKHRIKCEAAIKSTAGALSPGEATMSTAFGCQMASGKKVGPSFSFGSTGRDPSQWLSR